MNTIALCTAASLIAAGCAVGNIEQIARVHAECRQEARKQADNDKTQARLEEDCLERRRAEWAK